MFIVTEKAGRGRVRAARTPSFSTKAEADAYIAECPNAFTWAWQSVERKG